MPSSAQRKPSLFPRGLSKTSFGLAFEFFINVAHNFVEVAGVPESFSQLVWSQADAQVRGETSQDAWESRRRAQESRASQKRIDERARTTFYESSFSDSLAIYMLSLAVDFDYHDLREREYPLLAAPALAERLRHVAEPLPGQLRLRLPDPLPPQRLSRFPAGGYSPTIASALVMLSAAKRSRNICGCLSRTFQPQKSLLPSKRSTNLNPEICGAPT